MNACMPVRVCCHDQVTVGDGLAAPAVHPRVESTTASLTISKRAAQRSKMLQLQLCAAQRHVPVGPRKLQQHSIYAATLQENAPLQCHPFLSHFLALVERTPDLLLQQL